MTRKTATAGGSTELSVAVAIFKVFLYLLSMVLLMMGASAVLGQHQFSDAISSVGIYANSLGELVGLAAAVLSVAIVERGNTAKFLYDVGYFDATALKQTAVGFLLGTILISAMFGVMYLFAAFTVQKVVWPVDLLPALLFFFLVATCEELIFRGYIFSVIDRGCGTTIGVLASSLIFGFAHWINPVESLTFWEHLYSCAVLSFEAGLPLVAGYILTRRIWLSVGIHWAWDFMEGTVFGFIVSGADLGESILTSRATGNFFISGGAFGPEASIIAFLIGTISGAAALVWAYKNDKWRPFPRKGKKNKSK